METTKLSIEVSNHENFLSQLKNKIPDHQLYSSEPFFVLLTQTYYLRTNSNLLSTIILNFKERNRCEIYILSGGGGSGMIQMSLGSETNANKRIVKIIRDICDSNFWRIID